MAGNLFRYCPGMPGNAIRDCILGESAQELAAFMARAHAKFTGEVGVSLATSGPSAIHDAEPRPALACLKCPRMSDSKPPTVVAR